MNDVKKKNKKVLARPQAKAKHGKPKAVKKSKPIEHVRHKLSKKNRLEIKKAQRIKNRLARGQKVMDMLRELKGDIVAQIGK